MCLVSCIVCLGSFDQQLVSAQKTVIKKNASNLESKKWPKTAVYIPIDQLDALINRDRSGVLLPRAQYESLKKQAMVNSGGVEIPQSNIILHAATYRAVSSDRQILIEATISFRQFKQKLSMINLPLNGLAVEAVTLDQKPAMIARSTGKTTMLQLFSQHPGEHQLVLKLSAPLNTVGSDQVAQFQLLPRIASHFKIEIPSNQHLIVNDLKVSLSAPADKKRVYEFPIGGEGQVSLKMTEQARQQSNDSLVFARSAIGVSVSPGKVAWQAQSALNIYGQSLDQIVLSVPQSLEIVSVESTGLESWVLNDSMKDRRRTEITLNYRQPIEGERKILCRGVMTTETDQAWKVPDLYIEKVNSHVGSVLIRYPLGVRLQVEQAEGVRRQVLEKNPKHKGTPVRTAVNPGLNYDFWQPKFRITLITQEKRSEVQMAASTVVEINEQGMDLRLVTTVESLFAPLFEFQMKIPAEWTILGATLENKNIDWKESSREAGSKFIRLTFPKALSANTEAKVMVLAHRDLENWPPEADSQLLKLPEIELPQAKILEGSIVINANSDWDLIPSGLTNLEPIQEQLPRMRFGYQYQDDNYAGSMSVSRKPLQLAAHHLQYVRLDQTTLFSHFEATLNVERGSYRTLMVALPESAGTDLQFRLIKTSGKIIEQVADEPKNGVRVWTLKMDRRLSGKQILAVTVEQSRKVGEIVKIPQLQIMSADRQYGEVAFEAEGDQRLKIQATGLRGQSLTSIDAAELQHPVSYQPRERIVAAYRYVGVGHEIQAEETRFDQTAVPTAIAHQLILKSVLGNAGEVQNEALLVFSAVGIQSLRVILPDQSQLLSALVNEKPVEVRDTGQAFIVPVSADSRADGTHTLKLLYDANRAPVHKTRQFSQSPPQVAVVDGTGLIQPLKILNQSWSILYPDEIYISESTGDFVPDQPLTHFGMIETIRQQVSLLSTRDILGRAFVLFFVSIVLLICTYAFRRGGFTGAASLIGGFCFMAVLIALMLPAVQQSREAARRSPGRIQFTQGSSDDTNFTGGSKVEFDLDVQEEMAAPATSQPLASSNPTSASGFGRTQLGMGKKPQSSPLLVNPEDLENKKLITGSKRRIEGGQTFSRGTQGGFGGGLGGQRQNGLPAIQAGESAKKEGTGKPAEARPAKALGGRLSVVAPLPEPDGFRSLSFQYYGEPQEKPLALAVSLQEKQKSQRIFVAVIAAVFWLSWLMRGISCLRKLTLVLIGLLLPFACSALIPVKYQTILDGIFWGSVLAAGFWIGEWIIRKLSSEIKALLPSSNNKKATVVSLIILSSLLFESASVFAQKKPTIEPRLPQDLVVPYEAGTDPLSSQRIFLSREEFTKLWNAANPEQPVNQAVTSVGAISQALYAAKIEPGAAPGQAVVHVKGRLVIHTVGNQPVTLPLPLGQVAMSSALLDGKTATLLNYPQHKLSAKKSVAEHFYSIVIAKPGLHLLDLEFDLPAQQTGIAGSFHIDLLAVASGRLTLELPDPKSQISVTGTRASYRKKMVSEKAVLELPIDQGGDIQIAWRPAEARGAIQGVVQCKSTLAAIIQDAGMKLQSEHQYRIRQGEINQADLKISEELRIQSVSGPDVGGWEIVGTGEARRIKIFLRRDVKDTTQVNVVAFQPLSIGKQARSVGLPEIVPENITNETGTVGVYSASQFQVRPEEIVGAIQIDSRQFLNPQTSSPLLKNAGQTLSPQWAYRYSRRPLTLRFLVTRRQAEKQAIAEHAILVLPRKMSLSSRVRYQLKGIPESTFVVELPETYLVLNVNAAGLDDWYVIEQNADDMRVLVFEFKELKTNQVEVVFDGVIPREGNQREAEVMMPTPLGVSSVRSDLAIWCDESLVARAPELKDWRAISADDLSAELKGQQSRLPQFAFRSSAELPEWIKLDLSPAQPVITANSLVMTTVGNVSVSHTVGIRWSIQGAATDKFSFTTPAWLGEHLDFRGESIRQVDKRVIGGTVVQWTVSLQDSVEGSYFITAESTLSPPISGQIEIPQVRVMDTSGKVDPQTTELEIQQHFLMLVNHSWARLSLMNPENIASIDRQEMPLKINDSLANQAMELARIIRNGKPPTYQIQQFQADQGAAAAVNLAELTTVLANDGSWKTHADYRIRNRSRQFLAVRLPENTQVLSAFVKDVPTAPVVLKDDAKLKNKNEVVYLIALPKGSAADLSFSVNLILAGRLASSLPKGAFRWSAEAIDLQPPQIVIPAEDADYGIPVAQTKWTVYVPNDYSATALLDDPRTNMTPVESIDDEGLSISNLSNDVNNLYSVYNGTKSDRVRALVVKNFKQLEQKLERAANPTNRREGNQIKQQISEIQLKEQQRQVQRKKILKISKDNNGQTDFDSEETFNQLVIGNNTDLYNANNRPRLQTKQNMPSQVSKGTLLGKPGLPHEITDSKSQLKGFFYSPGKDKSDAKKQKGGKSQSADGRALRRQQSLLNANEQIRSNLSTQQLGQMPNNSSFGLNEKQRLGKDPNANSPLEVTRKWKAQFEKREARNQAIQGKNNVWNQLNDVEGVPNLPLGGPASLKSHTIRNLDSTKLPQPVDHFTVDVGNGRGDQQTAWTQAGGISLKFDVPLKGHKLVFSKINGQPKLALNVRSENTYEMGSAVLWTLFWSLILIGLVWYVSRCPQSASAQKGLGALLTFIGLAGWLLLSGGIAAFAMVCFVSGVICFAYRYVKQTA
ncbi:MAG: hypothetical protein K0U86_20035 [Planctomycetes bacterium]|nr:hypothetical protein [Planctomycetota bacterium]MCH9727192.1 hypothetical protein [Planctomycetota bacterium]MCH9778585.1 hypothetical protein [Planctomycetota bacterium]MCH9793259.1 hypothetical protein [Planctomycetota bacterium]